MDDDVSPPLIMKEGSSSSHTTTSEESSWTPYIVDFILSETKTKAHESPYSSSSSVVSSSDATTGESKGKAVADEVSGKNLTKMRRFKENLTDLRLKKRMFTGKSVQEDELEDTACSPVNNGPSFEEYGSRIS